MECDNATMFVLTRIFLHNWQRFSEATLVFEDNLYLAGEAGVDKTAVLAALQLVLMADLQGFSSQGSLPPAAERDLSSYIHARLDDGRTLRPDSTVAYTALEFRAEGQADSSAVTLGACLESTLSALPKITFFILPGLLEPRLFVQNGQARSSQELRQELQNRPEAQLFEAGPAYQTALLDALGHLSPLFFAIFQQALHLRLTDLREFFNQWLLVESPLAIQPLQAAKEELETQRSLFSKLEEQLNSLRKIGTQQTKVRKLRERHTEYTVLSNLLRLKNSEAQIAEIKDQLAVFQGEITEIQAQHTVAQATLKSTEEERRQAETAFHQADVVRQRTELQREIDRLTGEAETIHKRWLSLLQELKEALELFAPLLQRPGRHKANEARERRINPKLRNATALPRPSELRLLPEERTKLRLLMDAVASLSPTEPPPTGAIAQLTELLEVALPLLDSACQRMQRLKNDLKRHIKESQERQQKLNTELEDLRAGKRIYPPAVEQLRDLIATVVGERPRFLCELLDVPDLRWQNAVEAMLGPYRFTLVVKPKFFELALQTLNQAQKKENIAGIGLLDVTRMAKGLNEDFEPEPSSLASQVKPTFPALQPFVELVLGDIIACDSPEQLRYNYRAITPEVVMYSDWTARVLPTESYQPWYIGERANQAQIEAREQEFQFLGEQIDLLKQKLELVEGQIERLAHRRALSNLGQRLEAPLDDHSLRAQIEALNAELQAQDLSGVQALDAEMQRLQLLVEQEQEKALTIVKQIATLEQQTRECESRLEVAQQEYQEREQAANEVRARYLHAVEAAEEMFQTCLAQTQLDLAEELRSAETQAKNFETRALNELQTLTQDATTYNTLYQFAAQANNAYDHRYIEEEQRLAATEFAQQQEIFEQVQRRAAEELRTCVLHPLYDQIVACQQQLDRVNHALTQIEIHGERARLIYQPTDESGEYYKLINDTRLIDSGTLFEDDLYGQYRAAFDRFFAALTTNPQNEAEKLVQQQLLDYRHYFAFDFEITAADGSTSRVLQNPNRQLGGEAVLPFYLIVSAAFVQLYQAPEALKGSTIRLIAFQELGPKMDQSRLNKTLDLFQQFGLQVITAVPLEHCAYLTFRKGTSLVLTSNGDAVQIESYASYEERQHSLMVNHA